jgi:hypothetical protein
MDKNLSSFRTKGKLVSATLGTGLTLTEMAILAKVPVAFLMENSI